MSTVMYSYRVRKDAWWDTHAKMRDYFLNESKIILALRDLSASLKSDVSATKILGAVQELDDLFGIELQLFDEGATYLLRPLVTAILRDVLIAEHERWGLEPVFFDSRTDIPSEEEKNYAIAEWMIEETRKFRYFTVPVLTKGDLMNVLFYKLFPKEMSSG